MLFLYFGEELEASKKNSNMGAQETYDGPFKATGDEEVAAMSVEDNVQPDWTEEEERLAKRK